MSFTALNTGEVASAQPVTTTLLDKIRTNFDDHEDRITAVEDSLSEDPPIILRVNGYYSALGASSSSTYYPNGLLKTTLNLDITITGVRLIIDDAGSGGTTEIDLKYKRGVGAYTSIFSTKPSVASGAGDDATSSNAVLDGTIELEAGDIIKLDTTSVQTNGRGFMVRIDFNRTT